MVSMLTGDVRAYLESHRVGHLATADHEGAPHLVPVVFAVMDNDIVFVVDEKPKRAHGRALKRLRNIAVNPRVAFLVDDYSEDWSRLCYVLVQGDAEIIDDTGELHDRALGHLRARYAQYRDMRLTPGRHPVVRIRPVRVHRWQAATSPTA